jgi:hypothetical protein
VKPIPGFEAYAVDIYGNVFRIKTRTGKPCDPRPIKGVDRRGYRVASLRKDGKTYQLLIHRLVALTYLCDPGDQVVCHWNHNRDDNRLENLYVASQAENCRQSGREGRYGHWRKGVEPANKTLSDQDRRKLREEYATGAYKQIELAAKYGISQSTVSLICLG